MCLYPIKAWQFKPGEKVIMDRLKAIRRVRELTRCTMAVGDSDLEPFEVMLPCQKCSECSYKSTLEWAHRIMDESKYHGATCVLTLTYADNPVTLVKKDYQDFLKRLRYYLDKLYNVKIRYFLSGEYGGKKRRPHYHCIVFGWKPNDTKLHHYNENGKPVYISEFVEFVWGKGFCSVDDLFFDTAFYCAKYLQKQLSDEVKEKELVPPFVAMSLKPGIGLRYIDSKKLLDDKIYHNGKSIALPRYYLKIMERNNIDLTTLKDRRRKNAKLRVVDPAQLAKKQFLENYIKIY